MTGFRSRWIPTHSRNWVSSLQTDLLLQDFQLQVVPHRRRPPAYDTSTSEISVTELGRSLSLDRNERKLDGFVRSVAVRLLTDHEVWIEVAYGVENRDDTPFSLLVVEGVKRTGTGTIVQELPDPAELRDWYNPGDDWEPEIELEANRMVHVDLPTNYPSGRLTQVVRRLSEVHPAYLLPRFGNLPHEQPEHLGSTDGSHAMRTERLAISQVALPIGWAARESFYGEPRQMNDFYYHLRELRFLLFRSSLRARAEDALRQVVALAGEACGFTANVTAYGVYTPGEVEEFIKLFEKGKLTFSAVREIIHETGKDEYSCTRDVI